MQIEALLKAEKIPSKNELTNLETDFFGTYDAFIKKIKPEDLVSVKEKCDEVIAENSDSIAARYISASIGMIRRPHEDHVNMQNLLVTFYDVHNWKVVEFICEKILALNENKNALHCLADCYEETGRDDGKWAILERLVKVDYDERKIVVSIAEHALSKNNKEKAIFYYKKALNRYIQSQDKVNVQNVWQALFKLLPTDFGYFLGIADRINTQIDSVLATTLLNELLKLVSADTEKSIIILKKELDYNKLNDDARTALILAYRKKFEKSARLNECIRKSLIEKPCAVSDVTKAIESFELNIAFDKGSFVYQQSLKRLGIIQQITNKEVKIAFGKTVVSMSAEMTFKALTPLPKTNIRVLKACILPRLQEKVKSDINWTLRILLQSHDNKCSIKEMKSDLMPEVLSEKEWSVFLREAKHELMENPYFSNVVGETDTYTLRSTPITQEEKKLALFKQENDFYGKVRIIKEFVANKDTDTDSDAFVEMLSYFISEVKKASPDNVSDTTIASYLLLDDFVTHDRIATASFNSSYSFGDLYKAIPDKIATFRLLDNSDLKKSFIDQVIDNDKDWASVLKGCFPYYTYAYIPDRLKANGKAKVVTEILHDSVDNYKEIPDVFLWTLKYATAKDWESADITPERLLITQLLLLEYTAQCIDSKKDVTDNRKRNTQLQQDLFTVEKKLYKAIDSSDEEFSQKVYSIIAGDRFLDPGKKIEIRHQISERFPSFKFFDDAKPVDTSNLIPTGFLCTKKALEQKKAEADHIQHVDLQEVAKEIADARSLGDLRENSEYQYGKDKQKNLNAQLRTLSDEIERAQVITPDKVAPGKIGFGTEALLLDKLTNTEITYQIFGQWESNPDKHIINFKTPLGMALLNKVVGDTPQFSINGQAHSYEVLSIKVLDF